MLPKPLNDLTPEDFAALAGSPEGRTLEFKRELKIEAGDDRREFLADVSSLGNAQGGDLIFGVEEVGGLAAKMVGVTLADVDAEMQKLEAIIRDGLEPRLPVEIKWIPVVDGKGFVVVRVRPSFDAPHRVKFREHSKFYGRNSGGKYPMDVHELRAAFAATAGLEARIADIHESAVQAVFDDALAVDLVIEQPFLVVSYVPLSALSSRVSIQPSRETSLGTPNGDGWSTYPTIEGILNYTYAGDYKAYAACLTHREGYTHTWQQAHVEHETKRGIYAGHLESRLLRTVHGAKMTLASLGVEGPAAICVSITNALGCWLHAGRLSFRLSTIVLKKSTLRLPPLIVDDGSAENALLPLCQLMWNGFNMERPTDRKIGAEA